MENREGEFGILESNKKKKTLLSKEFLERMQLNQVSHNSMEKYSHYSYLGTIHILRYHIFRIFGLPSPPT